MAGRKRQRLSGCERASLQWQTWRQRRDEEAIMNFDKDLDARGLNCPLPILRAKKALSDMQSGQVLRILATDVGSVKDFQAFCKQTGNELLSHGEANKEFTFFMKRK
jgi:tRNA 2-thiouridine synthesizing protein A